MKAYQIKIEMVDSPSIWRRVVMPSDATFRRLHDVIQTVFNFRDYHLFDFDLSKDNMKVTNNEEAYLEHQHYKKNRKELEDQLKDIPPEFAKFEKRHLERLRTIIRYPTGIKIDKYIEEYNELHYTYDYGDDWRIVITLEKIIEDYYYGYPTLMDGEGTAPPEDVGGFDGYREFLKVFHNPKHPEHKEVREWAEEQYYRDYDPEFINYILKSVKYKKTEWEKINADK
ncbi:plasmid pRiA4b ORF-3 family protein [Ornithinibacillus californiensis]|uniref:plasmid pRiA4b ORF-3 family protein n=1 Tax=Ornithinibacillus californiensis TaxID=161536 RepID=UPI00064DB37B|nr:plasmid pRiA4b ORF-3 family protein [Ornithinibacillus californiensis]